MLIVPPALPRPPSVESDPRTICTESTANTSRRLRGEIAHAVDIDAALAVEAADEGPVADRVAALGRAEGDAGHGAQRILQASLEPVCSITFARQHDDRFAAC